MGERYEGYDKLREILGNQSQSLLNEIKQRKLNIQAEKIGCLLYYDGSGEAVSCNDDLEIHLIQIKICMLNKVQYVLEQLERGVYGRCSGCGFDISSNRLKAIPFAIRCRDCEKKYELNH